MGDRELVILQLWHKGRRIGGEVTAYLDWSASDRYRGPKLREYLAAALEREQIHPNRIGDYELEVRRERNNRHLTTFVTTREDT